MLFIKRKMDLSSQTSPPELTLKKFKYYEKLKSLICTLANKLSSNMFKKIKKLFLG